MSSAPGPVTATAAPQIAPRTYFEHVQISVTVVNESNASVLVEEIGLRFASDDESAIAVSKPCGKVIDAHGSLDEQMTVIPTPRYFANTNTYKIRVRYRELSVRGAAAQREHIYSGPPWPFLIIHRSPDHLGTAFISFKQPDDRLLADIAARFSDRAGFDPYLAERHPAPGTDVWKRIEKNLQASAGAIVLWTELTTWGPGVEREIGIIKAGKIPHALVIENSVQLPDGYDEEIEYVRFARAYPHEPFEKAVISIRDQVLERMKTT